MKLTDTNRFYLTGTPALHLATIQDNLQEYICFHLGGQIYIETISGGHLERIASDSLIEELTNFLTYHGVLDSRKPLLPDEEWLRAK